MQYSFSIGYLCAVYISAQSKAAYLRELGKIEVCILAQVTKFMSNTEEFGFLMQDANHSIL